MLAVEIPEGLVHCRSSGLRKPARTLHWDRDSGAEMSAPAAQLSKVRPLVTISKLRLKVATVKTLSLTVRCSGVSSFPPRPIEAALVLNSHP